MAYELKEGQGSLFKNDRKEKENQPDYTGKCIINGELMNISAWTKKPEGKKPFFSLAIQKHIAKQNTQNQQSNFDDPNLPF